MPEKWKKEKEIEIKEKKIKILKILKTNKILK